MSPRDASATRERIVDAAFDEFTECGFAGARVDRIADRACVNKSLLYQYFGDKEALFRHVLECRLTELGRISLDPDHVAEAVGRFFDFHADNPWLLRLLLWEALGVEELPNEEERTAKLAERVAAFSEAQRRGDIDPSLDPRHTVATLMAIVAFWFACPQISRMLTGRDPDDPENLAERKAHVMDVVERILEVR